MPSGQASALATPTSAVTESLRFDDDVGMFGRRHEHAGEEPPMELALTSTTLMTSAT